MRRTWTSSPTSPLAVVFAGALALSAPAVAQEADSGQAAEAQRVAKQLNDPVADLASIPLQFNWENGVGANRDLRFVLNVQPVVPVPLSGTLKMIGRFILPFVAQPAELVPGSHAVSGTGDIVASAFFSPRNQTGLKWGVGPVFGLPTTTDPLLGSGKWSVGPTAVVLTQRGPWTVGALVNHLWSISDTGDLERSDVSRTLVQPFLAYATKHAVTFSFNTESTCDWKAASGDKWTVPLSVAVSKVTRMGPFPFSMQIGGGAYVESPDGGPEWRLRLTYTLILPRSK
jgi:hypothetical protein